MHALHTPLHDHACYGRVLVATYYIHARVLHTPLHDHAFYGRVLVATYYIHARVLHHILHYMTILWLSACSYIHHTCMLLTRDYVLGY